MSSSLRTNQIILSLFGLLLFGCVGAARNNMVMPSSDNGADVFPSITVSDLNGEEHSFPAEFAGHYTLIVFAFKHEQQAQVTPWVTNALNLSSKFSKLRVLEMPTIESSTAAFRAMINNGMRSGISDPKARARSLPLFINKKEFLNRLAIFDESQVHPLLFNEAGDLIWRSSGEFTVEKLKDLYSILQAPDTKQH